MRLRGTPLLMLITTVIATCLHAQPRPSGAPSGVIRGRVVDAVSQAPLEYANVIVFAASGKGQVTGTISRTDGRFEIRGIRPGDYYLEVKFMGFDAHTVKDVRIGPDRPETDVGTVALRRAVIPMEEIEVSAEKPDIVFQIDKKVVNVGKQLTTATGTAVDVLENVPSVTVDIDGNVSLRGSTSFTVLVDGRPTVLEPSEVLQQIPASTIDNIEIITNPSARYDPDGISGIINVVTKKTKLRGLSGTANLSAGPDDRYGGDFLISYRRQKLNMYLGADYNRRVSPGTAETETRTYGDVDTSVVVASGSSRWQGTMYGLKAGIEVHATAADIVNCEVRVGGRLMDRRSDESFDEWLSTSAEHDRYISASSSERDGDFYSGSIDYQHSFERKEHELSGEIVFSRRTGDAESATELREMSWFMSSGQQSVEDESSTRLRAKLDYVLPLREDEKLEAGYQSRFDHSEEGSKLYEYDPAMEEYQFRPEYSHTSEYERDIHSVYTLYSRDHGGFGYQGGIRGEYTYRTTKLVGEGSSYEIDRWDLFPTLHASYEYSATQQVTASYTRRIHRPRGWYLEPSVTWWDAYNVREGNPSLKPEYIDSYELGYQRHFGSNMLAAEAYYRLTHNKIERIRSVYEASVIRHTIENVGRDYAFGAELTLNIQPIRRWNVNLMADFYDYKVEGRLEGEPFSEGSFNWRTRANSTLRITRSTRLQVNAGYGSPTASSQGEREAYFTTDVGVRQEFLDRSLSATLQVRDLLRTGKHEYTSQGASFYSRREFSRESPVFTLRISYNFNNYRPERDREREPEEAEFEGMEEF